MLSRENVKIIAVAAGCLVVGLSLPAAAEQARAIYANNSDKVDGKHAVGAGASTAQRKGKLVATRPTTGRLPDNIIKKAPDASRLGGYTHAALRTIPVLVQGGALAGGASVTPAGEVVLPVNGSAAYSFVVPPDYKAGSPLSADMVIQHGNGGPCRATFRVEGESGPTSSGAISFVNRWRFSGDSILGTVSFPSGSGLVAAKKTATWRYSGTRAGQFILLTVTRINQAGDTCGSAAALRGLLIRY
ncbi:hypothetical protein [Nocardioides speluncae]|uniref:hypothetical protein n=1 Tax=Nocardioides speluncae TaxID=2670337 RepID=UPI000D68FCA9|nr:hypothetical protein [Nocardioides speluncae]